MPQFAIAMVLGSLLAYYGNELPDRSWSALVPILLLLCRYNPRFRMLLLMAAAYLWSSALLHQDLDHRLLEAYDNRVTLLRGVVADIPEIDAGRIRLHLKAPEIANYPGNPPRLLRLNWYQDNVVPQTGEYWQFEVKLKQPRGLMNPGAFDFEAWLFSRGIDASGYIRNSPRNQQLQKASTLTPGYWRMRLASAIDRNCGDCAHRGLIKALALGFRGDISGEERNLLQSSGTAHLLAISGLHIGMVSLLIFALGRGCWRIGFRPGGLNRIQTASLMAIVAASVYAALAGFSLPTVRALVMLLILLIALLLRNRVNLLQSLSLAVIVIVLVDPRVVGSSSFWLSVCALLVIAFVQFRLPDRMPWWQQLLSLQCFFSLLFMPLGLLIFDQLNPAGFAANIVAIPVVSFILLPLILLACLLALTLPGVAGWLFRMADTGLQLLLNYLDLLLSSGMDPVVAVYPTALVFLLLALLAWLLLPSGLGSRAVSLIAIALLLGWQPDRPETGAFELVVFDVGMGTSVLLRTRHHNLVYDFGPGKPGVFSAADWALLPAMRNNAIDRPDLAIVSHIDQDHSGGLHRLLEDYPQLVLLSGTPRRLRSRFALRQRVASCHDYPDWRWDGVDFRFLSSRQSQLDTNNRSCVLMVEGRHRVLLPGDIESAREYSLLKTYGAALDADVLLAPHHGSDTSSSSRFVKQVAPRHVIYTLSHGNRWGFPSSRIQSRYAAIGASQYRSDLDGAITIISASDGLSVGAERNPARRIWRRW
ncbi:MAG: DNA internalization-related competence protein ComEC/Rec2 [Gammaproteobacteria bacterium]|nr:DNA internalization-related competence protein ComEC/Rec2 [Gammaproteobacteria bacterium]